MEKDVGTGHQHTSSGVGCQRTGNIDGSGQVGGGDNIGGISVSNILETSWQREQAGSEMNDQNLGGVEEIRDNCGVSLPTMTILHRN